MRVALLCIDPWRWAESAIQSHRPFNYAVRRIQAAIVGSPDLDFAEVRLIESLSLDVDEISARVEAFDPDIIGVSAYVWSFPVLLEICRRSKRARPDRTIIFGGPSSRPEMFDLPQHHDGVRIVDAIVVGEGEDCIREILLAPDRTRDTLLKIRGLALPAGESWISTGERVYSPLDTHPSPYQMGLMPPTLTAQLESFRGCPLSCTYCEWGDTGVTPRVFSFEHMVRELTALEKVKPNGTWLVDPGFNLSNKAFDNLSRAEAEVGALKKLGGFRCEVYPSHLTDKHLRFLEATTAQYAGIGLQSYDKEVLKGVERPFSEERFERVVSEVASIVPDTVVEVIMGLPGDNPDNFKRTIEKVRKLPVAIRVFHCLVLPSALMKRAPASFDLRFDPFTLKVISAQGWSREDLEKTCEYMDSIARNEEGLSVVNAGTWKLNRPGMADTRLIPGTQRPPGIELHSSPTELTPAPQQLVVPQENAVPDAFRDAIAREVREVTPWTLDRAVIANGNSRKGIVAHLQASSGGFALRAAPAQPDAPSYRQVQGIAYSYEGDGGSLKPTDFVALDGLIKRLHPMMAGVILGQRNARPAGRAELPVVNLTPKSSAPVNRGGDA